MQVHAQLATSTTVSLRILRSEAEIETVRHPWLRWQQHPNSDLEFFLAIARVRPEVISPYVIALYRHDVLETLLVGRVERDYFRLRVGYLDLVRVPIRTLTFVYAGLLGNASDVNCAALLRALPYYLISEGAQLARLHFVKLASPLHRAAILASPLLSRDHFAEIRAHWLLKLPRNIGEIYATMSPKARRNRRYETNRLLKHFTSVHVVCYTQEADIIQILRDAESIACRTYQRGLGVGFMASQENLTRFTLEAARDRLRAYFLYLDQKPVAFLLGTLSGNVLYDNFSAYDPDYGTYSPGTVLLLQILERLCADGVEAVDFGFGDAWYKAQFGNERFEEATISVFAPTLSGFGLNLVRLPPLILNRFVAKMLRNLKVFHLVKRRWRAWAQRQTSATTSPSCISLP